MEKPAIKIGDTVFWVHCSNKVYTGIVTEYDFCAYQGAVYLLLDSEDFPYNKTPIVHYSHCFHDKDEAEEFAESLSAEGTYAKRCDRCEYKHRRETAHTNYPLSKEDLLMFSEPIPIYVQHRYGEWQQDGWHIWSPEKGDRDCEIANLENYGICWDAFLAKPE
jgi:hypothetical protein